MLQRRNNEPGTPNGLPQHCPPSGLHRDHLVTEAESRACVAVADAVAVRTRSPVRLRRRRRPAVFSARACARTRLTAMDEFLANLGTDASMFDTSSVLAPAFDMDSGFMSDTNDNVGIYPSELSASLRNQQSQPTPGATTPTPQNMQLAAAEIDYLAVDDADTPVTAAIAVAKTSKQPPVTTPPGTSPKQQDVAMFVELPSSSSVPSAVPASPAVPATSPRVPPGKQASVAAVRPPGPALTPTPAPVVPDELPDTPAAAERRRLRPLAAAVVQESWCANRNPADFVAAVKQRLPVRRNQVQPQSIVEESSGPRTVHVKEEAKDEERSEILWQLPEASEGAVLDALFVQMVKGSATSTRFMSYLSYSLVTGIVSQRAVIATCLKWIAATSDISNRVLQSFARLMAQIIPNYRFSLTDEDLTPEVKEFLGAFTMIIKCTAKTPALAPELAKVLSHDRVVALVRACARRVPSVWPQIDAAIRELESPPNDMLEKFQETFAPRSAYTVAPDLRQLIPRLKKGLCMGITSLETIAKTVGGIKLPGPEAPLSQAITAAYDLTLRMFGREMTQSLRDFWTQREGSRGDFPLLVALEGAALGSSPQNEQAPSPSQQKEDFRRKVIACQAIVRFLSERASVPGATDKWKGLWGGKERLKRVIRDAMPQVKTEIKSESGALLVSVVVACCAAMVLGPSLRINDANDGVDLNDPVAVSLQETQNEEVEETMGELIGFAVGSLEDAAMAEETPSWRSFGLWLLLLMSRCGSMLRASGCEHVRAARVLRAWGGVPTGTPGSHTAHASSHKHSSQGGTGHQHAPSSSALSATTEGVTTFAASSSLAIIDVSDVSGSDETIRALCDDLVQ